jgi:glutamate/aspartate transport system permease protein
MSNLDFSFLTWNVVSNFVLKGLYFSIELTLIAMFGGIVLGTLIALMRLSSKRWLVLPAQGYVDLFRSIPLVMVILWFFLLIPKLIGHSIGGAASAMINFNIF